jgi:hypothetical protein
VTDKNMCPKLSSIHIATMITFGALRAFSGGWTFSVNLLLLAHCMVSLGPITRGVITQGTGCTYVLLLCRRNIDRSYS